MAEEEEYAEVMKSIRYGDEVEKNRNTLALLLKAYQKQAAENDELRSKIEVLEQDKFK